MLLELGLALALVAQAPAASAQSAVPAVEAQKMALARQVAAAMVPPGALGERMQARFRAFGTAGMTRGADAPLRTTNDQAFFDELRKTIRDPAFAERMRIRLCILNQAGLEAAAAIEPIYREAVAEALIRRLTAAQLSDVLVFVSTPSGKAFTGKIMDLDDQPEVVAAGKELMAASMQRMVAALDRVKQATEHLPPITETAKDSRPKR